MFDSLRCARRSRTSQLRIPPLAEQRAIAHILGTLDDKIELNRRMNETLEAMARALFKSWFVDFDPVRAKAEGRDPGLPKPLADLFPDSFEDSELGEIPKGWRHRRRSAITWSTSTQSASLYRERNARRVEVPTRITVPPLSWITSTTTCSTEYICWSAKTGRSSKTTEWPSRNTCGARFGLTTTPMSSRKKGAVSTEQFYLYFHFEPVVPYVTGAVQAKLSQGRMNMMPFVFGGNDVCGAFNELVDPLFAKLRSNSDENTTLAALRDTLLLSLSTFFDGVRPVSEQVE